LEDNIVSAAATDSGMLNLHQWLDGHAASNNSLSLHDVTDQPVSNESMKSFADLLLYFVILQGE